jgi:hypothetical protein
VAFGANFNVQRLVQGGTGLELVAAAAGYVDFVVLRMGVGFHFRVLALNGWARRWYALGLRGRIIHENRPAGNR